MSLESRRKKRENRAEVTFEQIIIEYFQTKKRR